MTQDVSRNFLASSKAEKKYKVRIIYKHKLIKLSSSWKQHNYQK